MVSCGKLLEREIESKTSPRRDGLGCGSQEGIASIIAPRESARSWPQASRWLLCDPGRREQRPENARRQGKGCRDLKTRASMLRETLCHRSPPSGAWGRQREGKGRILRCLSISCGPSGETEAGLGFVGENLCPELRSSAPPRVWVCACGRARRASVWVCLGEVYACSLVWGTCCQGVPGKGILPTFASLENQAWNFPEAHFLPLNP